MAWFYGGRKFWYHNGKRYSKPIKRHKFRSKKSYSHTSSFNISSPVKKATSIPTTFSDEESDYLDNLNDEYLDFKFNDPTGNDFF